MEEKIRELYLYKHYFSDFFAKQNPKVRKKILWTLKAVEVLPQIPVEYFKHLEGTEGLYEIRVQSGSDIFRIFCFFDEGALIVIQHSFQKKTQKTPRKEIQKALKIKKDYETEKQKPYFPR